MVFFIFISWPPSPCTQLSIQIPACWYGIRMSYCCIYDCYDIALLWVTSLG
jgi:hypothetical protein